MIWQPDSSWSHDYWPKEYHEYILDLIRTDHGGVLPEWALAVDLVYRADQASHPTKPVPWLGRRKLQEAWKVSERAQRKVVESEGWRAKCRGAGITIPAKALKGRTSESSDKPVAEVVPVGVPVDVTRASPLASPSPTNEPAQVAKNVPVSVPVGVTRASPSVSHAPSKLEDEPSLFGPSVLLSYGPTVPTSEREQTQAKGGEGKPANLVVLKEAKRPDHFPEALSVWNVEIVAAIRERGGAASMHPQLSRRGELGKLIVRCLNQHGLPPVLSVFRWLGTSNHPRAVFLREKGLGISTVLSSKHFEEYLGFSLSEKEAPIKQPLTGKHAHDPPPAPPEPVMDAAAKAEAARRFLEIQERRKVEEAKRLRRQQGGG